MTGLAALGLAAGLALCLQPVAAVRVAKMLRVPDCFAFIDRFAFARSGVVQQQRRQLQGSTEDGGLLEYTVIFPQFYSDLAVLMYYDDPESWGKVADDTQVSPDPLFVCADVVVRRSQACPC